MGRLASSRGYGLNLSKEWEPTVSIIVPTYNESPVVEKKLRTLAEIDYPREKVELIVVDSASSDGPVQQARRAFEEMGFKGAVLEEAERRGNAYGLNTGLKRASGELVCISDADGLL